MRHHPYHHDTPERAKWRALFTAALVLPDSVLAVTFVRGGGDVCTMVCSPVAVGGRIRRYALVRDLETSSVRRIHLDGVVKATLETHAHGVEESYRDF